MLDLVDDLYQQALKLHKSGKVELACQVYTLVLNANPEHSMANHNLGVLAVDIGKIQEMNVICQGNTEKFILSFSNFSKCS